jgi:RimJ/RimL family protein N-acetyltransferase
MPTRIDRYWGDTLGLSYEFLQHNGILVVSYVRPRRNNSAFIFVRGRTGVVVVEQPLVDSLRRRVGSLVSEDLLTSDGLQALFKAPVRRTVGPAFQGYAEAEDFRFYPSNHVRELLPGDKSRLQRLQAACEPTEWEHSAVKWKSGLFGYVIGGEIVAVAHYDLWAPYAASIGVITHPAHRGRGYGKAAVSAAMRHAFAQGHLVVYQTLLDNTASVALARDLGCKAYARTVRIYFE